MTRRSTIFTACASALVALSVTARAVAAPGDEDDPDGRAFAAGLACFDERRFACAIDAWEVLVERLGPARAWKVLYNLGVAHDEQGDATRALDRWESFLRHAPAGEAPEQRLEAQARIAKLRGRFGELVVPPVDGAAATVRVGAGRDRAAGFRLLVAPGEVEVVLMRPGAPDVTKRVTIAAGESRTLAWPEAPKPTAPSAQPGRPAATAEGSAVPTVLAVTFGIATVASVALPLGLGVAASSTRDEAIAAKTRQDYDRAVSDYEDEKGIYAASFVLPAVLAAATVGFVVWAVAGGDDAAASAPRRLVVRF